MILASTARFNNLVKWIWLKFFGLEIFFIFVIRNISLSQRDADEL